MRYTLRVAPTKKRQNQPGETLAQGVREASRRLSCQELCSLAQTGLPSLALQLQRGITLVIGTTGLQVAVSVKP
jgi:hypothetical protein